MKQVSLAVCVVIGVITEIKDVKTDKNGNQFIYFKVTQTNKYSDDNFDHWIKAWGNSKVNLVNKIGINGCVCVVARGEPRMVNYQGKSYPKMEYQVTDMIEIPSGRGGGGYSQPHQNDDTLTANEQQTFVDSGDDTPF